MKKLFASLVAGLVAFCGLTAFGATPVAVWDGAASGYGFDQTTQGDYALNANGNAVATDGSTLTINQDYGAIVSAENGATFGSHCSTIIIKFSGITSPAENATAIVAYRGPDASAYYHGLAAQPNGNGQAIWHKGLWSSGKITDGSLSLNAETTHTLAYAWRRSSGTGSDSDEGTKVYLDGTRIANWSGLYGSYNPTSVVIGGLLSSQAISGVSAASGMVVSKVAIFNSKLSADEINTYKFPSEITEYTTTEAVSGEVNWSDIKFDNTWTSGAGAIANITLGGDATITLPDGFIANKINVTGDGAVTFKVAEGGTATVTSWDFSALSSTSTITWDNGVSTIVAGTDTVLDVASANNVITIAADKKLTVKSGALTASKVSNNGTLNFEGGDAETPIALTGDGNFGTVTLAKNTYVKNTVTDNRNHLVTGTDLTSFYAISKASGEPGMGSSNAFKDLTLVFDTATGARAWVERVTLDDDANVAFKVNTTAYLTISPVVKALSGSGSVTRSGTNTLTINSAEDAEYAGTSAVPFTIGGTATQTFSGNYTGALTVNSDAKAKLTGSAAPSSIVNNGTVTLAYTGAKTLTATGTGTFDVTDGTVTVPTTTPTYSVNWTTGTLKVTVTDTEWSQGVTLGDNFTIPAGQNVTFVHGSSEVEGSGKTLEAQGITWIGGATGSWKDTANWSGNTLPTSTDVVKFTSDVVIDVDYTAEGPAGLLINANVTLKGVLTSFGSATIDAGSTLTVDGTGMIAGVTGGTFVKEGTGVLTVGKDASGYNFNGTTVKINGGEIANAPVANAGKYKNLYLVLAEGTTIKRYGWAACEGTMTIESDYAVEAFANTGNDNSLKLTGLTSFIKKGTGTLTMKAALENTKIIIEAGKLILDNKSVQSSGLTVSGEGTLELTSNVSMTGITFDNFTGTMGGASTFTFAGSLPTDTTLLAQLQGSAWTGTVWLKNINAKDTLNLNNYGNANSKIKLTAVQGYNSSSSNIVVAPAVELVNDTATYALSFNDGWSYRYTRFVFNKLTGEGTFIGQGNADRMTIQIKDWSEFAGTLCMTNKNVIFSAKETPAYCGDDTTWWYMSQNKGSIWIVDNANVTLPAGKTWTAVGGIHIDAGAELKLPNNSTTFDAKLTGEGALSADGFLPGDAQKAILADAEKNAGIFWLKNYTWNNWDFGTLGNANSIIRLTGVKGYGPQNITGRCDTTVELVDDGETAAVNQNDGFSYADDNKTLITTYTFAKIIGTGTLMGSTSTATPQICIEDASEFEGVITPQHLRIVIGTEGDPRTNADSGKILLMAGETLQTKNGNQLASISTVGGYRVEQATVGSLYTYTSVEDKYTVTFVCDYMSEIDIELVGGGTITEDNDYDVEAGETLSFTVTPKTGSKYTVKDVGGLTPVEGVYTTAAINKDTTIIITLTAEQQDVPSGEGCTIPKSWFTENNIDPANVDKPFYIGETATRFTNAQAWALGFDKDTTEEDAVFEIVSIDLSTDPATIVTKPESAAQTTIKGIVIKGATTLSTDDADWHTQQKGDTFYKAVLDLTPANTPASSVE